MSAGSILNHCNIIDRRDSETFASTCFPTNSPKLISCASICPPERDTRTLFVKNLPYSATADELKEVFEDAVDIRVPQGQNGNNRG